MKNLDVLAEFFEVIWEQGDLRRMGDFFSQDTQTEGFFPDMSVRTEDFTAMVQAVNGLVEEMRITLLQTAAEADWVAVLWRSESVSRVSGQPVVMTGQTLAKFEDGKITEAHNHMDLMGFFAQLKLLPEDLSIQLLGG